MSIVVLESFDLKEAYRIIAYATNIWIFQVVNEAGDGVDLSLYEEIRATFRSVVLNSELPASDMDDNVYEIPWSAADITPETHCRFIEKATGRFALVLGAIETKIEQDAISPPHPTGEARPEGLMDVVCYTTATGAPNSLQAKVLRGGFGTEWTSTKQTP